MGDGRNAQNDVSNVNLNQAMGARGAQVPNLKGVGQSLADYGAGKTDLQGALSQAQAGGQMTEASDPNSFYNALATGPMSGSKLAENQVMGSGIQGQLYGQNGLLNRVGTEEQDLAKRGYSMQPEDYEAYGQASGDIARQYGQQEQSLASALADRGLSGSNAAQVGFTGLQGSKSEQLAGAQRKIANDRMDRNFQRLQANRNLMSQLGQQGEQAVGNQFGRNLAGVQNQQSDQLKNAQLGLEQQKASQDQRNQEFQQRESTKGPSLGGILGGIAGTAIGGATGGLSTGLGGAVQGLFGGSKQPTMDDKMKKSGGLYNSDLG